MNRNVIVFGATGKTGQHICKELELENIPYAVFVREESSKNISNSSLSIKTGDVLNAKDVEKALENEVFTDVIVALGSKDLKNSSIRSLGTKNIIDALNNAPSKVAIHLISALGVGNSWSQLKWHGKLICKLLINSTMTDHTKQEDYVCNSTYAHHIIRPVGLKDGPLLDSVHVQNEGFLPSNAIQRADVAKFLVRSLLENKRGFSGICQK